MNVPRTRSHRRVSVVVALATAMIGGLSVSFAPTIAQAAPSAEIAAYNAIATTLPGNVPSEAFEATSSSEFGDHVTLRSDVGRHLTHVTVVMSSWGCESGHWNTGDCSTTPDSSFNVPITLKIYSVDTGPAPGSVVLTKTSTFPIPYRPSADNELCTGDNAGKWHASDGCYNGLATPITFDFTTGEGAFPTIPDDLIWTVAFNTTHYGYEPIGESAACYTSSGGCGYDSLNVGAKSFDGAPSAGSDVEASGAFLNSSWSGAYCDNGTGGTGTLRFDSPCWSGFRPLAQINVRSLADLSIAKSVSPTPVNAGDPFTIDLSVTNNGPDPATGTTITDDLSAFTDSTPANHPVFSSATYCEWSGTSCIGDSADYTGSISAGSLSESGTVTYRITATVSSDVRGGPLGPFTNTASVSSDALDDTSSNNSASKPFTVHTVPNPPTSFGVVNNNGSVIVRWVAPSVTGGKPIDNYRFIFTNNSTAATTTVNVPTPFPACPNEGTGTLCKPITIANNESPSNPAQRGYTVTIQAHNAVGFSDITTATTKTAHPSVDATAVIATSGSVLTISTCTVATPTNPVCFTYKIPSGSGGIFSAFDNLLTQPTSTFCGTSSCIGPGVANGLPGSYTDPKNPIQMMITWDASVVGPLGAKSKIYFDAYPSLTTDPILVLNDRPCTNAKGNITLLNDPCLKSENLLGSKPTPGSAGDLQITIVFTSRFVETDPTGFKR